MGNRVETVVKVGGSLLAHPGRIDPVLRAIARAGRGRGLLVVPGGGPFADAVRAADGQLGLSSSSAHWMAILAMDQSAHLVVERLQEGLLVRSPEEISEALESGRLPVLAPSRWMQEVDPLPHSWEVTGDSLAAWVAGAVTADRLVLVKPPGLAESIPSSQLVDPYFTQALGRGISWVTVRADQTERLAGILAASPAGSRGASQGR